MENVNKPSLLVGSRFGKLLVVGVGKSFTDRSCVECACDCGNAGMLIETRRIKKGKIVSCGCDGKSLVKPRRKKIPGSGIGGKQAAKELAEILGCNGYKVNSWNAVTQTAENIRAWYNE